MVISFEKLLADYLDVSDLLNSLVDNIHVGIAVTDISGELLFQNDHYGRMVSISARGLNHAEILSGLDAGHKPGDEGPVVSIDGFSGLRITASRVKGRNAGILFVWICTTDSQAESRQRNTLLRNLYRSFIDTSFELVFRTTLEGKILFINKAFREAFGIASGRDVEGTSISSFIEDQSRFETFYKTLLKNRKVFSETLFFRKSNGSIMCGKVNCHIHSDAFGVPVLNWTVLDISLQVESERELRLKNDQLLKLNHQVEKFLYSTSHDLRGPITTILGLVNLLRVESRDAGVKEYADKIEASTSALDKIIRDIMSFSRASYRHLSSERINFELLCWKVVNNYRSEKQFTRLGVEVMSSGGFPFYGDAERIELVLDNLVRNAIQFCDSHKSRPFVRINVVSDKTEARIEIIDNGIGIGRDHLSSIFDMFYKATHLSKGAGLGLYIVKETIVMLSGQVTVESEIGFGTVFRVTIPNDRKGRLINRKLDLTKDH